MFRTVTQPGLPRRVALGFLATGLVLRLLFCFVVVPQWESRRNVGSTPDRYPLLARSIVEVGEFGYLDAGASPTTVRGPGYALWLALALPVSESDRVLAFWGSLPGLIVGAAIGGLMTGRLGVLPGIAAGAVATLHPLPVFVAARAMGDEFYGALAFLSLLAWSHATHEASGAKRTTFMAAAAFMGLHLLCRTSAILTLAACALPGLLGNRGNRRRVAALLALSLAPAIAWSIRSTVLEGRPVYVHSLAAYNFWVGEGFDRARDLKEGDRYREALRFVTERAGMSRSESGRFWYGSLAPREVAALEQDLAAQALSLIWNHPVSYGLRVLRGIGSYWVRGQTSARSTQYAFACLPVVLLALWGARAGATRGSDRLLVSVLLFVALHNLAYAAVFPMARLSVQTYPALAFLCAFGVWDVRQHFLRS